IPYLFSKLFILGIIVGVQCLLLFLPLKFFDIAGLMPMPGDFLGIPQLFVMLLTAAVGVALGLFISALVKTSEMATSLVPLILIPQILFSGLVGVPSGVNKAVGLLMPATWSFDTMKRFSGLNTLEEDGAYRGRGLYKDIEAENDKIIADAKTDLNEYKENAEQKLKSFENDLKSGKSVPAPTLDDPPKIADAKKIPRNLSSYVSFLHPFSLMNEIVNQIVLMLMFFMLVIATLIVLRLQDIG
ncbi:MAG TPA: ABC transporter permease, partial [Pyrinomonadaceae bacterium]|nr:ABC transporter permease [Pyrinomonadaceae bacterium]